MITSEKFGHVSSSLLALALYIAQLNYAAASYLNYEYSSQVTALLLFLPVLAGIVALVFRFSVSALRVFDRVLPIFFMVWGIWLFNYASERIFVPWLMSELDEKRLAFFVLGPVLYSIAGMLIAVRWEVVGRTFFSTCVVLSAFLSLLYLGLYDGDLGLGRIGGDAGLSVGIAISQGFVALICLQMIKPWRPPVAVGVALLQLTGVVMSGTRAALVVCAVALFLYLCFLISRRGLKAWILVVIVVAAVAGLAGMHSLIPEETLSRVTNFNLEGSEDRFGLVSAGLGSLMANPFGKVTGYLYVFPAELEYSHNTVLQVAMELGVLGLIPLVLAAIMVLRSLVVCWGRAFFFALATFLVAVLVQSISSGDAYFPQFWFMAGLMCSVGFVCSRE